MDLHFHPTKLTGIG